MKQARILLVGVMISWLEPVNGQVQSSRFVYHTDGLGSVAAMTDGGQQTAKSYGYEAFGKIRAETGSLVINRYTYTSREALGDSTGLFYYRWRVMDPNLGRFTSEDPLRFVEGPNLHLYVRNMPMNRRDPTGRFWHEFLHALWELIDATELGDPPMITCTLYDAMDSYEGATSGSTCCVEVTCHYHCSAAFDWSTTLPGGGAAECPTCPETATLWGQESDYWAF